MFKKILGLGKRGRKKSENKQNGGTKIEWEKYIINRQWTNWIGKKTLFCLMCKIFPEIAEKIMLTIMKVGDFYYFYWKN